MVAITTKIILPHREDIIWCGAVSDRLVVVGDL